MNWRLLGLGLAGVSVLVGVLAAPIWKGTDPHALPSVLEGRMAPGFALTTLEGEAVDLASLAGKPLVLNFWATWCQPCKLEHPNLLEGARRNPGVAFLGVLYGDTPEKAKRYLDRVGSAYPTLVDPGQRTAMDYGVGGVPETFFIDREGRIVKKLAQPLSATELQRQVEAIQ